MLTLGQLAEGSRGGGSVLLYSSELRKQNMTAVSPKKASILESWGNGTNTEVRNNSECGSCSRPCVCCHTQMWL